MAESKRTLVVVESPAKARTIAKYLGKGYTVKATVGHIRDLPERELGVDVEADFTPKFVTVKGRTKAIAELKQAARAVGEILVATDPDREGEAIAWHVQQQIGKGGDSVRRVLFHEITKDAVRHAIEHPTRIDTRKVDAQLARRILDRLVGFKVSPLLWKAIKTGLSAGRVQTVALRLIVEREEAIRRFVPLEYWSITAKCEQAGRAFDAELHKVDGRKPELHTRAEADGVVSELRDASFVVTDVKRKERRKRPPPPFTTSTLQQEAAKRLGFSSRRTMRVAQQLYEGVELGAEGAVGLITYMRTDSTRVAPSAALAARGYVGSTFGKAYLSAEPNFFAATRDARSQDAHEAIRPAEIQRTPDLVKRDLSADQFKLYQVVWQRFVASQMAAIVYDTTTVDFDLGRHLFRATGSIIVFDGYHRLYHEARERGEGRTLDDLPPLPPLGIGDRVTVRGIVPEQHFTEPPPRFSEASLVKELERLGIGRPSTYAQITSTLAQRHYVSLHEKRFHPSDLGETVNRLLIPRFPDIFDVEFTSEMESELDRVEEGELSRLEVLRDFWQPFEKRLAAVRTDELISEAHDLSKLAGERCPECGSPLTAKTGRFGPYIACTKENDPSCKYTKSLRKPRAPDRPSDEICRECGSPMVVKTGRFGEFLACTRYPKCKHSRPLPLGVRCPKCGVGDLAERRSKRGRAFFGCGRYPECDFSTWNRPVPAVCPACGNIGAESRRTTARGPYRKCLRCATEFAADEREGAASAEVTAPSLQ
ncbi:MAG: type I DNA topoisomerase [Gemmatimonadetes bacterium]|nr:type I DNA topoisomerase [Gemmatimonadota bacterium]